MDDKPEHIPAGFLHCETIYKAMLEQAQVDDEGENLVYEGFLTHLFEEQGFSVPYYTTVMKDLRRMGCVVQLRRGGSSTPSRWQLEKEPTLEAFIKEQDKDKGRKRSTNEQRYNDLNKRVATLEKLVEALLPDGVRLS